MAQHINQLVTRLHRLGYSAFEIGNIVREAIGEERFHSLEAIGPAYRPRVIRHLERYERLGRHYLHNFSK